MSAIDWKLMRVPIVVLLVCMTASISMFVFASRYSDGETFVHAKVEQDFTKAKRRYSEARRDKLLYRQYVDKYLQYSRKGIIGEEQRLSWIEQLQEINRYLKLPSLKYEISPQQSTEIPGVRVPRDIVINSSKMQLTAGLLHEGDLLTLLRALRNNANGFFSLKQCELNSKISPNETLRFRPNVSFLNISCQMDWYTVTIDS